MSKKDETLKDILDFILYENPSTQDEIAEKFGITRRYVNQLLQPLVKEGTVKRVYMIDLKGYEKLAESLDGYESPKNSSGNVLLNDMLINMAGHVHSQLEESFDSVLEYDEDKASRALEMDYATKIGKFVMKNSIGGVTDTETMYYFIANLEINTLFSSRLVYKLLTDSIIDISKINIPIPQTKIKILDNIIAEVQNNIDTDYASHVNAQPLPSLDGQTIPAGTPVSLSSATSSAYYDSIVIPLSNVTIDTTTYPVDSFPLHGGANDYSFYNGVWWVWITSRTTRLNTVKLRFEGVATSAQKTQIESLLGSFIDYSGSHLIISDNGNKSIFRTSNSWVDATGTPV